VQDPVKAPRVKGAGLNRCRLIRETLMELLQKRRRHLLRHLRPEPAPFQENESLVQLLLVSPEQGFLSIAPAPLPFAQRHVLSHFPAGYVPLASDKAPPSRAFAKLVEAEQRLGRRIQAPETCVDLGAAPGSWTYVAARRGARVISVDRSELRDDLMRSPQVRFERADAFRFEPPRPVDWLICDVIAAAERSADLLRHWLGLGWCRRFIVTLKLDDAASREVLERLEADLLQLCSEHFLLRLCANKKEVCAFGARLDSP
jgi:23S rRNA (cytidine2498-2'-O)-methyltransferase